MTQEVLRTYPLPIAQACGVVVRSPRPNEQLNAILRAAEVTARYLAALGIASFAARDEDDEETTPPDSFDAFRGALSYGHFLSVAQNAATLSCAHPLQNGLRHVFRNKRNPANRGLITLLDVRNGLGHDLLLDEAIAVLVLRGGHFDFLEGREPYAILQEVLDGVREMCSLPLTYTSEIGWRGERDEVDCLLLMGEGDPVPTTFRLGSERPFPPTHRLYVGVGDGLLSVHPKLLWDAERERATQGVFLVDRIEDDDAIQYRSVKAHAQPRAQPAADEIVPLLDGSETRPVYPFALEDGRQFVDVWGERPRGHRART